MKQFGFRTHRDGRSQRSWTDQNTCHVGVRFDGRMREVYRIERVNAIPTSGKAARDEVHVSDMLDEGGWFQPTVEKRAAGKNPKTVISVLAEKYERLARKQILGTKRSRAAAR